MSYKRSERVAEKLERKQQALLEAAVRLFAEKGYSQVTVRDIARLAGVATGTFYLYFRNKDSLLSNLINEYYKMIIECIETARRASSGEIAEKLAASMWAVLKFFSQRRGLARLALVEVADTNPRLQERVRGIQEELTVLIREDLEEAAGLGLIPSQNCTLTAKAIVGGYNQVINDWLREGQPARLEAFGKPLVDFAMRGAGFASYPRVVHTPNAVEP